MKKLSAFVVVCEIALGSSTAFAGGMADPVVEPELTPVVVECGASSDSLLWLLLGGAAIAALVGDESSTTTTTSTAAR